MSNKKRYLIIAFAVVLAVVIALLPAPEGLTSVSMRFLGIFIAGLILVISNAVPDWIAFMSVAAFLVLAKVTDTATVFAQFHGGTIWLLIMVFSFAAGIGNSGILVRIAYKILTFFPASFRGAAMAMMTASVAVSPLIPSGMAKINILVPVGNQLTEILGLKKNSLSALALFAAVFVPNLYGAACFMTGSPAVGILLGMMGAEGEGVSMMTWLSYTIVYLLVLLVGFFIFCTVVCKPKEENAFTKEFFREKAAELGPMSSREKIAAGVLIGCIVLWSTTSITGFDTTMIGIIAILIMVIAGLMDTKDFISSVPWSLIVFIGIVLGMSNIMAATGWNEWLSAHLSGIVGVFTGNIWIFVIALTLLVYVLRFAIIETVMTLLILLPVITPFMASAGISMFIPVWVIYQSTFVMYAPYMCSAQMGLIQMCPHISFGEIRKMNVAYMIVNLIGLLASIPMWHLLGLC